MYQNFETNLSMTILEHVKNNISLIRGHLSMKTKLLHKTVMLTKKTDNKKAAPNYRSPLFYLFSKPSNALKTSWVVKFSCFHVSSPSPKSFAY